MMKRTVKLLALLSLIAALMVGMLSGCGTAEPKEIPLEPFAFAFGTAQEEVAAQLPCVYRTNVKSPTQIYVMNPDNGNGLQAYGTVPSTIIYEFNLVKADSDAPRLGKVVISFPQEDYEKVLAYLDAQYGERYFADPQWGTTDANVYLFEEGLILIEYSSSPLTNPENIDAEKRDRYIALNGISYGSAQKMAALNVQQFQMLWMFSTAETDFVKVDNTQ